MGWLPQQDLALKTVQTALREDLMMRDWAALTTQGFIMQQAATQLKQRLLSGCDLAWCAAQQARQNIRRQELSRVCHVQHV